MPGGPGLMARGWRSGGGWGKLMHHREGKLGAQFRHGILYATTLRTIGT